MYYSIAIIVLEKAHTDIHPRKKKSSFKRLFIRQYDYFRMKRYRHTKSKSIVLSTGTLKSLKVTNVSIKKNA